MLFNVFNFWRINIDFGINTRHLENRLKIRQLIIDFEPRTFDILSRPRFTVFPLINARLMDAARKVLYDTVFIRSSALCHSALLHVTDQSFRNIQEFPSINILARQTETFSLASKCPVNEHDFTAQFSVFFFLLWSHDRLKITEQHLTRFYFFSLV